MPSASRIRMKPPPPMLPAAGSTTARAKAVATAASTALPPLFKISTPACDASSSSVTTIACAPRTACLGHAWENSFWVAAFGADCEAVCCERTKMPVRNVREGTRITFLWTNMSRKTLRDSLESVKASPSAVRDPRKTVPGRPPRGRNEHATLR